MRPIDSCLAVLLLCLLGLTPLQAQVLNGTIAEDPITAHWKAHASVFNPAWAGASREAALFIGGQNLVGVLDSLSGGSSLLGFRSPIGQDGKLTICGALQYSFVPFVARFVTADVGFAYRVLEESGHRVWVGGTIGLGSREIVSFDVPGQPATIAQRNRFYPNLNAGIWYRYQGFHFGAGGMHLGSPMVRYSSSITGRIQDRYYLLAAFDYEMDGARFTPAIWTRFANTNAILTDLMLDSELGGGFGLGLGYRTDMGRRPAPNPSNPFAQERFRQAMASAELRLLDVLTVRGTYLYTFGTFVLDRNNVELTLVYRYRDGKPSAASPVSPQSFSPRRITPQGPANF